MNQLITETQKNCSQIKDLQKELNQVVLQAKDKLKVTPKDFRGYLALRYTNKIENVLTKLEEIYRLISLFGDDSLIEEIQKTFINLQNSAYPVISNISTLEDLLLQADEIQNDIIKENLEISNKGFQAEEEKFCSEKYFPTLTKTYYRIGNGKNSEKAKEKLTKQSLKNELDNNGIKDVLIGE